MRTIKLNPLTALIIIAVFVTGATSAAYIIHYRLEQPATVSIIVNPYTAHLYKDEACTTVAAAIAFPDAAFLYQGAAQSVSPTYYFKLDEAPAATVSVIISVVDLPAGMTLTGERHANGEWRPLTLDGATQEFSFINTNWDARPLRFTLNVGDNPVGDYSFMLIFDVIE